MTFKDLVAPRLQGCLTIGLLIISQSVKFEAGSQQLLCCPITVLLQIPQAKDLCVQQLIQLSLKSAQFMPSNHSNLEGCNAALFL